MTADSQLFESLLREGLAPLLRRKGYKKSGHTWRKQSAQCVQITHAQAGDSGDDEDGKFTLNLGVYFPDVDELGRGQSAQAKPLVADCLVQVPIGLILPPPSDHWWRIEPDVDLAQLAADVASGWTAHGKRWLDAHADPAMAQACLVQKRAGPPSLRSTVRVRRRLVSCSGLRLTAAIPKTQGTTLTCVPGVRRMDCCAKQGMSDFDMAAAWLRTSRPSNTAAAPLRLCSREVLVALFVGSVGGPSYMEDQQFPRTELAGC